VIGTSAYKGGAVFFGEDAVLKAVAIAPEIREKIPADFGRDKALAWYGLLAYQIVWATTAAAGEVRILRVHGT